MMRSQRCETNSTVFSRTLTPLRSLQRRHLELVRNGDARTTR